MRIAHPYHARAHVELVPLIDTFFLLLAFFISSMLSMSVLKGLPLELPMAAQAVTLKPKNLIVITVANDGQLQLEGQPVSLDELTARLAADPNASTLRAAVRVDRIVPTGRLVRVLSAVREAGVHRVGLVTDTPDVEQLLAR